MKGYVYIPLLLVVLIALGFVLSGGVVLSKQFFLPIKNTGLYKLVDKEALPSNSTLQLSTLDFVRCSLGGLDIALVIDNSGSIDPSNLSQVKNAVTSFITAFSGTSTQFSVTKFATSALVIKEFTNNLNEINSIINSIPETSTTDGTGATNWQDALIKAKSTLLSSLNRPSISDLIVFVSDGNPTVAGPPPVDLSNYPHPNSLSEAVIVANTIKAGGVKILALGIGNSISVQNLQKIAGSSSGVNGVLNTDVILTNFNTLAADLAALTTSTCAGGQVATGNPVPILTSGPTPTPTVTPTITPTPTSTPTLTPTPTLNLTPGVCYTKCSDIPFSLYSLVFFDDEQSCPSGQISYPTGIVINGCNNLICYLPCTLLPTQTPTPTIAPTPADFFII